MARRNNNYRGGDSGGEEEAIKLGKLFGRMNKKKRSWREEWEKMGGQGPRERKTVVSGFFDDARWNMGNRRQ
jgi:hypothetical protein